MKPPKSWLTNYATATTGIHGNNNNNDNGGNNENDRNSRDKATDRSRKSFGGATDDTFRNYMARKIHQQRMQFGLLLPPPDPSTTSTTTPVKTVKPQIDTISPKQNPKQSSRVNEATESEIRKHEMLTKCSDGSILESPTRSSLLEDYSTIPTISPTTKSKTVRFDEDTIANSIDRSSPDASYSRRRSSMLGLVSRLKRKHGRSNGYKTKQLNLSKQKIKEQHRRKKKIRRMRYKKDEEGETTSGVEGVLLQHKTIDKSQQQDDRHSNTIVDVGNSTIGDSEIQTESSREKIQPQQNITALPASSQPTPTPSHLIKRQRPDLFFFGITVLVNGYTEPSTETIMRTLHKHGGDLEKYETSRVTHIIAQNLSSAKANIYKRQKRPIPVVKPQWIVDCVEAKQLLPHGGYLLEEVKDKICGGGKTMESFARQQGLEKQPQRQTTCDSIVAADHETHCDPKIYEKTQIEKPVEIALNSPEQQSHLLDHPSGSERVIMEDKICETTSSLLEARKGQRRNGTSNMHLTDKNVRLEQSNESPSSTKCCSVYQKKHRKDECRPAATGGGGVRTVGTDPNFLESYFKSSRLSFIGSFKQRLKKTKATTHKMPAPAVTQNQKCNKNKDRSKRFVFHVDMDCFFAAVAIRNYPQYKNKPVAVGHAWKSDPNGIVQTSSSALNHSPPQNKRSSSELSTCNYIARKYGIKKGMFLHNARELCPDLIVLPYDYEGYEEVTCSVGDILHRYTELYDGVVEQVSCDEAYIEIYLSNDADIYDDDSCLTDDKTKGDKSCCDLVNSIGDGIRKDIFDSTCCTASVGIGANKLLAKLATDSIKPDGLCFFKDWKECLTDVKLRDLPGIGRRMENKLVPYSLTYVRDIWDIGEEAEAELCTILGPGIGKKIYKYCNGEDERYVQPVPRKTIGAECNYGVRFNGPYGVDHMMSGLANEVARRMEDVGVVGNHITVKIKERKKGSGPPGKFNGMGSCNDHSKSCILPTTNSGSRDPSLISRVGMELFNDIRIDKNEVRGMGIVISKLNGADSTLPEAGNMSIWLNPGKKDVCPDNRCKPSHTYNSDYGKGLVARVLFENSDTSDLGLRKKDVIDHRFGHCSGATKCQAVRQSPSPIEVEEHTEVCLEAGIQNTTIQDGNIPHVLNSEFGQNEIVTTTSARDSLNDIALPSYSQIDMVEVMALPESFRDKILTTLGRGQIFNDDQIIEIDDPHSSSEMLPPEITNINTNPDEDVNLTKSRSSRGTKHITAKKRQPKILKISGYKVRGLQQKDDHFQQPDVKRMLKLASIKSGNDKLEYNGERVSLTQLDYLPLNVQLQVANNDIISLNRVNTSEDITSRPPYQAEYNNENHVINLSPNVESSKLDDFSDIASIDEISVTEIHSQNYDVDMDPRDEDSATHQNDCIVIRNWLDTLQNPTEEDALKFREYLYICISEKRLDDVVKYLQIIKRRNDTWGKNYGSILRDIDNYLFSSEGRRLDLCWLGLK